MLKLFLHQWLETKRSLYWQKSVVLNILSGIIGIFLLLNFWLIGFYADDLIQSAYHESNTISLYTGLLMFYFLFDLFARFMMQKNASLTIQPYLILPVPKHTLVHHTLIRSIFSYFNAIALCLIIPFFVKVVAPNTNSGFALAWLITILSLVFINNFLVFVIKKQFVLRPILFSVFSIGMGTLLYLNFSEIYHLSSHFSDIVFFIAGKPFIVVIPITFLFLSYCIAYNSLRKSIYFEDVENKNARKYGILSFLTHRGQIANLVAIELKLIFRNKRSKTAMLYGLFMIPYGLLLLQQNSDDYLFKVFIGFMNITGMPMMYGQMVFSWESSHFDGHLTRNISIMNYLKSKYLMISLLTITTYFLSLPLVIVHKELFEIQTAMLFYTIGLSSIIILTFGCFKRKRINLSKSQLMNYEGVSMVHFLMILPLLGIPVILYFVLGLFAKSEYMVYGIGLLGLAGIVFNHTLLQPIARLFIKRKYLIGQSFRTNQV